MRRRSGALHCDTQQQLIELASNHEMGLYYNEGPLFKQLKMDQQWTISQAQDLNSFSVANYQLDGQDSEQVEELLQLNRGLRYLENFVVDKETIRCNIQICVITNKMQQILTNMLNKESLLNLFMNKSQSTQKFIYKDSKIQSFPNSNVFLLETSNVEYSKLSHSNKQNQIMTPKNWLKCGKKQKMMELLIVKKHISICDNSKVGADRITVIYKLFIVNQKYLLNPLIKIYVQKSHFVLDTRGENFRPQTGAGNLYNQDTLNSESPNGARKTSVYNKIFNHKSFFDKDCTIYNQGQFFSVQQVKSETCQFRNSFHKIDERINKEQIRKLNDILVEQKRKCEKSSKKFQK